MSIFGNKNFGAPATESFDYIQPTAESLDTILTEGAKDSYVIRAGMYISDVMMEEAVSEGAAEPEALLESFGKDLFAKLKEMFEKLWKHVKDWLAKVKRFFSLLFTSGKEFVDKFEEELNGKTATGYTFNGYPYDYAGGTALMSTWSSKITAEMAQYQNGIVKAADASDSREQEAILAKIAGGQTFKTSDVQEKLLKDATSETTIEAALKTLTKKFRGGKDSETEIKDFQGNSKSDMMKFIKGKEAALATITNNEKDTDSMYSNIIKAIKDAADRVKGEQKGKIGTWVTHSTEMLRYGSNFCVSMYKVEADMIKEMARTYEAALKGYLRFKPVKDSFGDDHGDSNDSILESAMRFV
jgi:hypothetical protein